MSDYQNGLHEDRIRQHEDDEHLDSLFKKPPRDRDSTIPTKKELGEEDEQNSY